MITRRDIETHVGAMPGVQHVRVIENPDAPYYFWLLVVGGDYDAIWAEVDENRIPHVEFGLMVSRAAWWWRLWCWVCALMPGGEEVAI